MKLHRKGILSSVKWLTSYLSGMVMQTRVRTYIDALLIVVALGVLGCQGTTEKADIVRSRAEVAALRSNDTSIATICKGDENYASVEGYDEVAANVTEVNSAPEKTVTFDSFASDSDTAIEYNSQESNVPVEEVSETITEDASEPARNMASIMMVERVSKDEVEKENYKPEEKISDTPDFAAASVDSAGTGIKKDIAATNVEKDKDDGTLLVDAAGGAEHEDVPQEILVNVKPEESVPEIKIVPENMADAENQGSSELEIIGVRKPESGNGEGVLAMATPEIIAIDSSDSVSEGEEDIAKQKVIVLDENNSDIESVTEIQKVVTVVAGDEIAVVDDNLKVLEHVEKEEPVKPSEENDKVAVNMPKDIARDYQENERHSFFGLVRDKTEKRHSAEILSSSRSEDDSTYNSNDIVAGDNLAPRNRTKSKSEFDTSKALKKQEIYTANDKSDFSTGEAFEPVSNNKNGAGNDSGKVAEAEKIDRNMEPQKIIFADAGKAILKDSEPVMKDGQDQVDANAAAKDNVETVADAELRRLAIRRQMNQLEAQRKLIRGRKLFDSQQYDAAFKLFKEAEALDPDASDIQNAIRMTKDLVEGAGIQTREQLADKLMRQAVAREQYSAIQVKRLLEMGEKLLAEVKSGTLDTADLDHVDLLSVNKGKVDDALENISKVELLLQGDLGGGLSKADLKARVDALRNELTSQRDNINGELEAISRTETMRAAKESARDADETLMRQINDLMKSANYYFERDNFAKAADISEEVLRLDPNFEPAKSLFDQARNFEHDRRTSSASRDLQQAEDEWILDVEEMAIPTSTIVTYPEDWENIKLRAKRTSMDTTREAWMQRMQEKLDTIKITMDFDNLPLRSVIQYIEDQAQINIVMDKTVEPDAPVTLNVRDMTLGKALDWILKLTEQRYYREMRNEALYISSSPKSDIYMKLYPVYDLTHSPRDYKGPEPDTTLEVEEGEEDFGGLFGDDDDDDDDELEDDTTNLIENITRHIAPESWTSEENAGKISINMWQDNLLVLQTASIHAQIADYLNNLRSTKKQQILVGTRFLNISEDFLEQIGVSWQDENTNSSALHADNGGQDFPSGIGTFDWTQQNAAGGNAFNRYGKNYGAGLQIVPGLGTANYTNNGGIKLNTRYLSRQILNDFEINAVIEAVRQNKKGSILHNPKLIVANGRNAFMEVRTTTNYIASYNVANGAYEPEIQRYSQGVVFDVKPVISFDKKYITIRMRPTMSSFVNSRTINMQVEYRDDNGLVLNSQRLPMQLPQLALTRIWTYATVPNGGSVMLGGLIRDHRTESSSGVPLISNVPVIGRLTRSDSKDREKQNLLLIVTAKIVELDQ